MNYQNPVIPGFHPDPSICRDEEGGYYLVTSSFEYAPAVPLFYSTDLVNWTCVGHCLESEEQVDLEGTPPSGGIFAPTIRKHEDTYYMITTNVTRGVFYVTSKNPKKGWSAPIFLRGVRGIDPSLFWEDGKAYMQIAVEGKGHVSCIAQAEVDLEQGKLLTELEEITYGTSGRDVEAPHIYKKDGYYYLLCAEGGTREGHMITIQRSRNIWGPFIGYEKNPILTNRNKTNEELQGTGHGDLVQDYQGNWWCVALAFRPVHYRHVLGRETILLPAEWEQNQWPSIYKGFAENVIETEKISAVQERNFHTRDCFGEEPLAPHWNKLRKFQEEAYEQNPREGCLMLKGSNVTLDEAGAPVFLGRRQEHHAFSFTVDIWWEEKLQDSGLALYMDPTHHMEICLKNEGEKKQCFVRKTVGEIKVSSPAKEVTASEIQLQITGDKQTYSFYVIEKGNRELLDWTRCSHLATEVADSDFTGVYMGMYSQAAGDCLKAHQAVYEENKENKEQV